MAPEPKKMKIDPTSSSRTASLHAVTKDGVTTSTNTSARLDVQVHLSQTSDIHLKIQRAKNYAVAQAQQEGCMSNFRVFDSPFGNFLVPVIPTRSDLGG
ncbi:hypothetical protein RHSIM_Rhsim05G0039400 [Rhododendron simsii]|uniref:Uncharacterized protein n=1 Tax=Rhododendron simsii TaxID=118357 RepID=A0A834LM72_RHOSS|nr:hypothetical protein RHSIM_Rhsim05G0039400 [Rhododendron simsii]